MIVASFLSAGCALIAVLLLVNSFLRNGLVDFAVAILIILVPLFIMKVRGPLELARYLKLILGTCATFVLVLLLLFVVGGALTVGLVYLNPLLLIGHCLAVMSLILAYVFANRTDRWKWLILPFSSISLVLFALVLRVTRNGGHT